MGLLKVLPMAFVMIAGPQIISAVFLATTENWRRNCAAYVLGAACSISIVVIAAYYLIEGASNEGASNDTLYYLVLGVLVFLAIHTYRTRKTAEPPKWMGRLQEASPSFSLKLGLLLLGVFPTDILTSVAVGTFLSAGGDPVWHYLPFLGLVLLFLATPALIVLAMGERGQELLPKVRDWMNTNSWVVNEIVIGIFIALTISNLAG
jgi:threonine/homoserine/homoserine lactone efflux protein